jgi:hypothetical protein
MTNENREIPEALTYPQGTVAILNNGNTAIVIDDHCYAIRNLNTDGKWGWSAWIFKEALDSLKMLPENPDDAKTIETLSIVGDGDG